MYFGVPNIRLTQIKDQVWGKVRNLIKELATTKGLKRKKR